MKCVYCGRKNKMVGNCGVCEECCVMFNSVCGDKKCYVGEEVRKEFEKEFEKMKKEVEE